MKRLPDFVIIGAGKSGTTTLFEWLGQQPEVFDVALKEPRFFSRDWDKGLDWYAGLYAPAPLDQMVGDASTNYTDVEYSEVAAERMASAIPAARLIYLLRHPIERLRSQYRHNWRRAAESRPLVEAVQRPDNPYLGRSLYFSRLQPYLERFAREQVCVVRFEDLVTPERPAWSAVLAHLGLEDRAAPGGAYNVTADQAPVSGMTRRMADSGFLKRLPPLPPIIGRWGPRALQRLGQRPGAQDDDPLSPAVTDALWADVERLEGWLGVDCLWPRSS